MHQQVPECRTHAQRDLPFENLPPGPAVFMAHLADDSGRVTSAVHDCVGWHRGQVSRRLPLASTEALSTHEPGEQDTRTLRSTHPLSAPRVAAGHKQNQGAEQGLLAERLLISQHSLLPGATKQGAQLFPPCSRLCWHPPDCAGMLWVAQTQVAAQQWHTNNKKLQPTCQCGCCGCCRRPPHHTPSCPPLAQP